MRWGGGGGEGRGGGVGEGRSGGRKEWRKGGVEEWEKGGAGEGRGGDEGIQPHVPLWKKICVQPLPLQWYDIIMTSTTSPVI